MKKRGFTLIELIGVIMILGVVVLIATPTIRKLTSNSKEELYNVQINNIKDGLKNWAIDNSKILPQNEGEAITITLGQLKMGGYIDVEIKNPKNNQCFGNDMILEIKRYQKNYIYTVNDTTGTETTTCDDYMKPYIALKGNAITYVEVNGSYVDAGVIAKDVNGNDITNMVVKTITGSGNTIDTSKIGNKYIINYSVTIGSDTTSINRTVIVNDTTAPELIVPGNVVLAMDATSFDAMEGVTATDNSGETINVMVKSNISFGIPGDYDITYTATDSSGNTTVQKRIVTIKKLEKTLSELIVETNECATIKTAGACAAGTMFTINVNDAQTYDFYVIGDTGSKVTLIMSENLGLNVAWASQIDYITAGGSKTDYGNYGNNNLGPITALNYLNDLTDDEWTNIPKRDYTYSGIAEDGQTQRYEDITRNMKARMITYKEAITIKTANNGTMPAYMYDEEDYWTSTANESYSDEAWLVHFNGELARSGVSYNAFFGVRPVIELYK